jgi:type 1 glutamine amidotransferase
MTIRYGEGRVFHTTLGHVGPRDELPVATISSVGFIVTLQRGTEWAASGRVTQAVPGDFPGPDSPSLRDLR